MAEKKTIDLDQLKTILEQVVSYIDSKASDSGSVYSVNTTVAADNTSTIVCPLTEPLNESSLIYQNGILISSGTHYTLSADKKSISLVGYTAQKDDIFTFITKSTGVDIKLNATASNVTIQNKNSYFDGATDVESALNSIGGKLNGGIVSSVKVNGTAVTPDSSGAVDIPSPTIKLNGTAITPSTDGTVNIKNVVTTAGTVMTGNLVAKPDSSGNHVRNIAVYSSTDGLPTTGNDGDIILVYADS